MLIGKIRNNFHDKIKLVFELRERKLNQLEIKINNFLFSARVCV